MTLKHLLYFLALFSFPVLAQEEGGIKGLVKTSDGQPAEFITIAIKNSSRTTSTNNQGEFEIKRIEGGNKTLVISFIGLETKEIEVQVKENETVFVPEIVLKENHQQLDEVVVTGSRSYKDDVVSP